MREGSATRCDFVSRYCTRLEPPARVDERLSHPLGIKVCPTCSAEAEAETAVDRESPATLEGHREEDAGGNRS